MSKQSLAAAFDTLDDEAKTALTTATTRVKSFHERQVQEIWQYEDELGKRLRRLIVLLFMCQVVWHLNLHRS